MKLHPTLMALAAAGLLAGCGGGNDDAPIPAPPPAASNTLPPGATASTDALALFALALAVTETGQALDINAATLPTSETATPVSF